MPIKRVLVALSLIFMLVPPVLAADHAAHADMAAEHGGGIFHMFRLEADVGGTVAGALLQRWDLDGWIGTDDNKLWLKSEGERADNQLESAEFWALYSRNIATFWDAQMGVRYDATPQSTAYVTLGLNGLAPQWFETEAHVFISQQGDVTARLRQENDFLLTQKLILQPYIEVNFSAQTVKQQDMGAGITDGELGLQTRYEFTRTFAPYVDVHYGRKFGETASIAQEDGEDQDEWVGTIGLRFMF
jgi:copper resistance protein B